LGLFHNKYYHSSESLSRLAWKRFLRNKLSLAALSVILLAVIIAILGYFITPDPTPYANRQIIEIAMKKPGFTASFLKIRKNEKKTGRNLLTTLAWGRKDLYQYVPFQAISFRDDKVILEEFTGEEGSPGLERSFSMADVLFPVLPGGDIFKTGDNLSYTTIEGLQETARIPLLEQKIRDEQIVKKRFLLGTDQFGRDMLSRLMIGTRVSLSVGVIAVVISLLIGITIGALGGFFKGWIDQVVIWLINVVWSIPTLLLVIAITFALGKGFWQVFIAVGLTMWVEVARVTRGQILSIREKEYIEAARALGFNNFRIIFRHVLPNILGPVIVISAANFASAILIEAGLSFLGIGVQPPMPSWGSMIRENYAYIILDYAYLAVLPGAAIMLMVLAFMICGNGLRDVLDVKVAEKPNF